MSLSVHSMTVAAFVPMLENLEKILGKAAAHAAERKLDEGVLEGWRLTPDMFALRRQVQLTSDFAKNSVARLAGVEPPKMPDEEKTLAELQARVRATVTWLQSITPTQLEGAETRHIVVPLRTRTLEMDGLPFIQRWVLPNFYFHMTTTYALLRQAGVSLGKQDFLGGV
ncbi:MAG: hypothetical protein RLZ79_950 [Pseudomonadota bacterium]|jgi:hypothetical protein